MVTLEIAHASLKFCDSAFLLIHFNRQEILYQYYAYAFHGSAVSIFLQSVVASGRFEAAREKAPGAEIVSGSLLGTHRSAIGQFFPLPLEGEVPEVIAKVNSAQFPSRF